MIPGRVVNHRNEAVIPVQDCASIGSAVNLDAVMDTGFSGYLSRPPGAITALQLPFVETQAFSLGNSATVDFEIQGATVL